MKLKNLGTKKTTKKLGKKEATKKLGKKAVAVSPADRMAAARAAKGKTGGKKKVKRAASDMPDLKKLKDRHIKALTAAKKPGVRSLLTVSKVMDYFRSLGLRAPKDDILAATTAELYSLFFRAAVRTVRNNRKTVRGFDIR